MSKFVRVDGSPIKTSHLYHTKGNAPHAFNKHTYGQKITLKYDRTKFRPDFAIAPKDDDMSQLDQEQPSTM